MQNVCNKKVIYLMCKWLVSPRINHNEFNLRDVFNHNRQPKTKDEKRILMFKKTFLFLIDNDIDKAVKTLTYLYDVNFISAISLANKVVNKKPNFDLLAFVLRKSELPLVYLILFFNALRVKYKKCPIIFRENQYKEILFLLNNKQYNRAKEIYNLCYNKTIKHLEFKQPISKNGIIKCLNDIRTKLDNLQINKMLIYGSYARDEANENSDLDIIV